MTSSATPLGFNKQGDGDNANTWGDVLNAGVIDLVDEAIRGIYSFTLTGTVTLDATNFVSNQARRPILNITGGTGGTVIVPTVSKPYLVINGASGAAVISAGGVTTSVDAAGVAWVVCDGTNVKQLGYAGYNLKDYIDQAVLTATGSLPATTGNNGKVLACVLGAWTPTLIDSSYISGFSAGAAAVRAGAATTSALTPGDLYNALAEVTLTDATTIAVDMATFINAAVTLGGNRTLGNPTNVKAGQRGRIRFIQDGTGTRTLAFSSNWKRAGGAAVLTTTAAAIDVLEYDAVSSTYILYDVLKNPS